MQSVGPEVGKISSRAEIVPLGSDFIVHARQSGAIALANRTAVEVWHALEQFQSVSGACGRLAQSWGVSRAAAQSYVTPLLADWERAGLLAATRALPVRNLAAQDFRIAWKKAYPFGSKAVAVRTDALPCGVILDRVLTCLGGTDVANPDTGSGKALSRSSADPAIVDVAGRNTDFSVYTNGVRVWGPSEFAGARHMALREVLCASERPGAISAVLHAGAVAKNGKAVVLAGDSGAGKTTLLTSLILAGWDYMADDLTGLDREGREIWSFPVAISLKPGSAALLASDLAEVPDLLFSPPDEFGLRYLDASARRAPTPRARVVMLCFVQHDASCASLEVEKLSPTAALGELLQCGTRVVGAPPTVAALARLLDEVPCYRLRYADRREATAFLEAHVGDP